MYRGEYYRISTLLKLSFINITQFWMTPDCASEVFLDKRTWILQERKPEIRVCLSQVYVLYSFWEKKIYLLPRFFWPEGSNHPSPLSFLVLWANASFYHTWVEKPFFTTPGLKSLSFFITHDLKNLSFYHTSFEKPQLFITHGLKNLDLLSHVVWKNLVFTTRGLKSLSFYHMWFEKP